ncbi:N-acetylglucosamine kinase [Paragonimus westermani]|uniref:N-acetylglucosamine kinase n=1 Tax=Paragonimus westermani TaxID=34504 RepID=A0A5J4P059_9TREM|nr:N-acetylglucosamine kinase [Paragonimus westermani]
MIFIQFRLQQVGLDETVRRLLNLIDMAIETARLPPHTSITHLCMTLSGVDTVDTEKSLIRAMRTSRPNVAGDITICNDAMGAYMAATDGRYYISHLVIKKFLEIEDGLIPWEHSMDRIRKIVFDYFEIQNQFGLLYHFYEVFNKGKIAGLCKSLAAAAREGEPLCEYAFQRAGIQLGRHVRACVRHAIKEHDPPIRELLVICCGKIFESWDLLQTGFQKVFAETQTSFRWQGILSLVRLQLSASFGAARLAARLHAGLSLPCPPDATVPMDRLVISL